MDLPQRYLDLLKGSLLNEIYLENEVRFLYVFTCLALQEKVDPVVVTDIHKKLPEWVAMVKEARKEGNVWWRQHARDSRGNTRALDLRNLCEFSHTMMGRKRMDNIEYCLDAVRRDSIPGDLIETGVWRGGGSIFMRGYLAAWDMRDRTVWVADSFAGLPVPTLPQDIGYDLSVGKAPSLAVPVEDVQENFRRYGLLDGQVRFLKGWFRDTLPTAPIEQLAVLRLDGDLYESTMDALNALYDKVAPGGFIIVDDYGDFPPCRQAIDEFRARRNIVSPLEVVDWTGAYWRKHWSGVQGENA
jgi:O-methyltransferase